MEQISTVEKGYGKIPLKLYLQEYEQVKGHWLSIEELYERMRIKKLCPKMLQLEYEQEDDDDKLPCECFICLEPFVLPVVTLCNHYFCRPCAVQHFDKDGGCFVCNKPTQGRFRNAHKLRDRIAAEQEK